MKTIIELPYVLPGLNGPEGLIRQHHRAAKRTKTKLWAEICAQTRDRHPGKVTITYTRASVQAPDWDNLAASFKHIGDALVQAGVIKDDKPRIVTEFRPRYAKAKNNNSTWTRVEIESV